MHSTRPGPPFISCGCQLSCVRGEVLRVFLLVLVLLPADHLVQRRVVQRWEWIEVRFLVGRWELAPHPDRQVGVLQSYRVAHCEPYVEKAVEQARVYPDRRDLFLCHAWGDRQGSAAEFHSHLKSNGASVWFSEEDLPLGSLMIREIDKGLRNSRIGIVLVTPELIKSINAEGIAEKELAVLLASRRVIPVMHGVTFDELNNVSPMLASHAGLNTADSSLDDVAVKVAAVAAAQAA